MSNSKFPFPRLPDDICSEVLKTMEYHEIIAFSIISKKSSSMVQSLCLPLIRAQIVMGWPEICLDFGSINVLFKWKMGENDKEMTSLDDIPVSVAVKFRRFNPISESKTFTWSNQGKNIGEWVQHLRSIFRCGCYEATFCVLNTRLDIQSLRNTFPKFRKIVIMCLRNEPTEHEVQSIGNILRAFLPYVENLRLQRVPLQENLSIQHIGMTNLKELHLESLNLKLGDLSTLNVEKCIIIRIQFSLLDLNRFFKLWTKGSYPKLQSLLVHGSLESFSDWNILLKGLNAVVERSTADDSQRLVKVKRFIMENSRGVCAQVLVHSAEMVSAVTFTVSNLNRLSPEIWKF
ncbi:hypothetical protein B9Z55_011230 [Caenorhabditis nigoni]|uniref:F-box domain-containing protein n=1 Tax=Caenorhabditis nigoni TaxID=1611254 RepID=A0A2G5UJ68_9PELO|nr:hypothetical protein B9Z55_011230 [Caenorhabditis nigoni]